MSCRVTYSDDAKHELEGIVAYLAQFYAGTARKFKNNLVECVYALKNMPFMHPAYQEDPFFRRMVFGDYVLFYDVNEDRRLVTVHHIWHAKRDVTWLLAEYRKRM